MELTLTKPIAWRRKEVRDAMLYEIYKTRCRGMTFEEFIQNPPNVPYIQKYLRKYPTHWWRCYTLYFGTVNVFPPAVAYELYVRYSATAVLDPCAGWGGRMIASDMLGIQYDGYDTNLNLKQGYDELKVNHDRCKIHLGQDSAKVQFQSDKYDFILTSPPYYTRESYSHMPSWQSKQDFVDSFFVPMCRRAWIALKVGGHMALNIPVWLYDVAREHLGDATEKWVMPKCKRPGKEGAYTEFIYVWKKEV